MRTLSRSLLVALLAAGPLASLPAEAHPAFRLPSLARPTRYDVHLRPDAAHKAFSGDVAIALQVPRRTATLVLNSLELRVHDVTLDGRRVAVTTKTDDKAQTLTLTFQQPIRRGSHTLGLAFNGKLTDAPRGLYLQPYQANGKPASMLVTQLEPTDARRIFPLWDEPALKAAFALTVDLPKALTAVSNMPVTRETPLPGGLKRVTFQPTPPMASYLMVLCAGDLESVSRRVAGVDLRVVTTRGKREQGRYALDALAQILPYYNDYFGVKYPLPKLDLIGVPGGFGGAMENWGGIVFNDATLLYDPHVTTERGREFIYRILAHEVAHQWFGDLVTMAWWDDLWLNEGFADWMEVKCTARFNPTWPVWLDSFDGKQGALRLDANRTTHPIAQPIEDATEADAAFDMITYNKGEAVIRMLESAMGPDAFRAGIRRYMRAHKLANARTADLWSSLGAVTKLPVARIAPQWISRPGFPLLDASIDAENIVTLAQHRYSAQGTRQAERPWPIPLRFAVDGEPRSTLFDHGSLKFALEGSSPDVKLGLGGDGIYRVHYDDVLFARLKDRFDDLPEADRVDFLADTWAQVQPGYVTPDEGFGLVEAVSHTTSAPVLNQLIRIWNEVLAVEDVAPGAIAVKAAIRERLQPLVARLGWDARKADSPLELQLRTAALKLMARVDDPAVLAEARRRWQHPQALTGDQQAIVQVAVGEHMTAPEYDAVLARARKTDGADEKEDLYTTLALAHDPALAARTLPLTVSGELDPPMALTVLGLVAQRHPDLVRAYVTDHRDALYAKRTTLDRVEVLRAAYGGGWDDASAASFETAARPLPAESKTEVAKVAERIRLNAAYARRLRPAAEAWAKRRD